jgi:hypothetical protein
VKRVLRRSQPRRGFSKVSEGVLWRDEIRKCIEEKALGVCWHPDATDFFKLNRKENENDDN